MYLSNALLQLCSTVWGNIGVLNWNLNRIYLWTNKELDLQWVSHLARAHDQALKDLSRMSLVLLSNHEILLHNDRTSRRFSLFLFTRYAQMFRWMNLAEKDLKLLGWNNLLCACTRGIIIFPHDTWCRSLPIQQMFMLITLKIILRIKLLTTSLDVGLSLERGAYTVWRICSME